MKFGIHNPSWWFGPESAEAFEAAEVCLVPQSVRFGGSVPRKRAYEVEEPMLLDVVRPDTLVRDVLILLPTCRVGP